MSILSHKTQAIKRCSWHLNSSPQHLIKISAVFSQHIGRIYMVVRINAVAQWLRCCATNQKVAVSIPADVIGIFH